MRGELLDKAAEVGMSTIGIKTKWLLMLAALGGWSIFVAATANKLTRNHYKAGQLDAAKLRIEALEDVVATKDGTIQQLTDLKAGSEETMQQLADTFVEVAARQPKHTTEIRTEIKDAPVKYAAFDPNRCLSYVFPDGMSDDQRGRIESYAATLPTFDSAGRRTLPPAADGRGSAERADN